MTAMFGFGARVATIPWLSGRVLVACLIGFYVLLPLDRGFPTIPLFGRPLNSAIAATLGVLFILAVQTRGAVLAHLREPYGIIQTIYACALLVAAVRAPSPPSALHWSLLYYSTFVLNYVILRHVTRLYGTAWLSNVVVGLGIAAAAVGVMQSVIGMPPPMYDAWYENYFKAPPPDYSLATSRAAGTMNNAILYSVLMALVVPYTFDLKSKTIRAVALFAVMFAAGLSGSRTGVFVVGVFAAGAVMVYRWRAVRAMPAVGLGLVLLAVSLTWLTSTGEDSRGGLLVERLSVMVDRPDSADAPSVASAPASAPTASAPGAETPPSTTTAAVVATPSPTDTSAALGVSLRRMAVMEGIREMTQEWGPLTWIMGQGSLTAASIGTRIVPWYNTVDNVFLSVVYERGLSGLALFMGAFVSLLIVTRRAATKTVHWYAPVALAAAGFSFCWDAYSMFNILAVGSMAVTVSGLEQSRDSANVGWASNGVGATVVGIDHTGSHLRPSQE